MELNNVASIQQMLEQLPTDTLREMLDKELHTEPVNGDSIRLILNILRQREKTPEVVMTPALEKAWEKYQTDTDKIWEPYQRTRRIRSWAMKAAAAAAVLGLLIVPIVPQDAGAESLWDAFVRWTTGIVEFFGPKDNADRIVEYEFNTDNPGLQQVYDAVVELGITTPVVPMWLPEGYELVEFFVDESPAVTRVHSRFTHEDGVIVYFVDIYDTEVARMYQKNDAEAQLHEYGGTHHYFINNTNTVSVVWTIDKVECFMSTTGQEDVLVKAIKSIYSI